MCLRPFVGLGGLLGLLVRVFIPDFIMAFTNSIIGFYYY